MPPSADPPASPTPSHVPEINSNSSTGVPADEAPVVALVASAEYSPVIDPMVMATSPASVFVASAATSPVVDPKPLPVNASVVSALPPFVADPASLTVAVPVAKASLTPAGIPVLSSNRSISVPPKDLSMSSRPAPSSPAHKSSWASVLLDEDSAQQPRPRVKLSKGVVHTSFPSELLKDQVPLWSKFIVGHFIGDVSPHIGKVHATVNRLWNSPNKKMRIDAQFISSKMVLFKIEDDFIRRRILQKNFWHISDTPMVVQEWNPSSAGKAPDLSAIPIWVDFIKVPGSFFSKKGLLFLGNLVGNAIKLHPSTERCTRFDVARVLVEVNLNSDLPSLIKLSGEEEISISVAYPWLPSRCTKCGGWGHKVSDCTLKGDIVPVGSLAVNCTSPAPTPIEAPAEVTNRMDLPAPNPGPIPSQIVTPKSPPVLMNIDVPPTPPVKHVNPIQENTFPDVDLSSSSNHTPASQTGMIVDQKRQDQVPDESPTSPKDQAEQRWTTVTKAKGSPTRTIMTRGQCVASGEILSSRYQILGKEPALEDIEDIEDGEIQGTQTEVTTSDEEDSESLASLIARLEEDTSKSKASNAKVARRKNVNKSVRQTIRSKKSSSRKA